MVPDEKSEPTIQAIPVSGWSIQVDDFPVSIGDNMGLAVLDAPGGRIRDLVYVWRDPLSVGVQIGKYSDQGEQEKTSAEKLQGSVRTFSARCCVPF